MRLLLCLVAAAAPACAFDLMSALLKSPLYTNLLVPATRSMMITTAKENGVPWADAVTWIRGAVAWELDAQDADVDVPAYYRQPFHAYEPGNLCWEAAWEAEAASRAVGARNYPAFGADGEEAFRGAFDDGLVKAGARAPGRGETVLDLGCSTGHATRRLAAKFPLCTSVVGVDLSPHMLAVARRLPGLCKGENAWINAVGDDARVSYVCADAAALPLGDAAHDVVVLSFVVHELPPAATRDVVREAYRVLKPGGQLWVTEMARVRVCNPPPRHRRAVLPYAVDAGLRDGGLQQAARVAGVRVRPEHGAVPGRVRGVWRAGRGGGVRGRGLWEGRGRGRDGAALLARGGQGRRPGVLRGPARGDQAAGHAPQNVGE